MSTKALITGVTGFVGSHLAELLIKEGLEVYGTCRWRSKKNNIEGLEGLNLINVDIRDAGGVYSVLNELKPDYIFHLAAQSFVLDSWRSPNETLVTNISGNLNILEAMRHLKLSCHLQVAGSSEEYGFVKPEETPITEDNPLRPMSPYGVSKVTQDFLTQQYVKSYGLWAVVTRAFNHTGPRRDSVFAASTFAKQIADIEKGNTPPIIYVGDLTAQRDFTDVRDMVWAYYYSVTKCKKGEAYNICSGVTRTIQEVLDLLLNLSTVKPEIVVDPKRLRPSDVPILLGDCSKFKAATGWEPRIPFSKTMEDLLNYWRKLV